MLGSEKKRVIKSLDPIFKKNSQCINIKMEKKDIWSPGLAKMLEESEVTHKTVISYCKFMYNFV